MDTVTPKLYWVAASNKFPADLLTWDLNRYDGLMAINAEEVDLTEKIVQRQKSSLELASNFEVTGPATDKIGLKFGTTPKVTFEVERTTETTLESDRLGNVRVAFEDKVVLGVPDPYNPNDPYGINGSKYIYSTRVYSNGYFGISVEPRKIQ